MQGKLCTSVESTVIDLFQLFFGLNVVLRVLQLNGSRRAPVCVHFGFTVGHPSGLLFRNDFHVCQSNENLNFRPSSVVEEYRKYFESVLKSLRLWSWILIVAAVDDNGNATDSKGSISY